jgi:hypothetical protein
MTVRGKSLSSLMKPRIGFSTGFEARQRKRATCSARNGGATVVIDGLLDVIEAREGHKVRGQPRTSAEVVAWRATTIIERGTETNAGRR